jgi:flagellar motor switch protein FliN/FliY
MTEDLDKDLEGLAGDLGDLDLGDALGDAADAGEADASAGADAEAGEESVELDDDLQAMLDGGSDAPAAAGRGAAKAPAQAPPRAAPAPARPAPPPPTVGLDTDQAANLEFLLDIKLHVTFEVGRSKMLISDLLTLGQGSVIELHRLVGDELDLLINGKLIAKGEVVVVNEKFGCKITDIISPEDRVKHLGAI